MIVSPSCSRNFASFSGLSGEMPSDLVARRLEGVEGVGEVAGLLGAARRHRGRVEVDDHLAPQEVAEARRRSPVSSSSVKSGAVSPGERRGVSLTGGSNPFWRRLRTTCRKPCAIT